MTTQLTAQTAPEPEDRGRAIRSPNHRIIYSDAIGYRLTAHGFTITFCIIISDPGAARANVLQEEVVVTIPFGQLRSVAGHTNAALRAVEQEFGAVKTPKAMKESVDEAFNFYVANIKTLDLV
ncbi:MAG: hypothetical protein HYR63_14055 [Proteobacteria bacterium]|nr:hypothetical protein [Pseudomonadota bacterium]